MSDAPHEPPLGGESDEGESAELRALYARLRPAPLPDELAGADPETVRVVGWMQSAWRGLAVPPARVPRRARPRLVRPALAVAAALLLLGCAVILRVLAQRAEPAPQRSARSEARAAGIEVLAVLPDRLELRSGPVRLVLLDPPPTEHTDPRPGS